MSALAGVWNFDGKPDAAGTCARMLAAQAIYGPHDVSQWDDGPVALGRRLFRTLTEDVHDRQPLAGGAGRFTLVADLRLDNRDELIGALRIADAAETADSAILMAAWERWGESCFDRLVGDYAFALWDAGEHRLTLARDPLGARPLHYHRGLNFFAFASMPKGLHALPVIPRRPDEERVAEFLALLPEGESASFFQDVKRVAAGHVVVVAPGGIAARRHWQPQRRTLKLASAEEYAEGLRHHLDQAVRAQLRGAGGTVAAHLSSGFDSSAVASTAARLLAPEGGKVVAFTAVPLEGFAGPALRGRLGDEGPIAAKTAALYPNMEHVPVRTPGRTPLDNLDRNFFLYDQPVLNLCNALWGDAILDGARARKLSVLLTGQMGNMSISYDGLTLLPQLVRRGHWLKWLREGAGILRRGHLKWRGLLNQSFGPYAPLPLWTWANRVFEGRKVGIGAYSALRPERAAELDLAGRARARALDLFYRPRRDGFESRLWVLRRVDLGNHFKGALGGWGVDLRDPTADRRLIEFSLAVPEDQFLVDGEIKALTRLAFADRLPPEVINVRGKGYQAADWHVGLTAARPALREEIDRLAECGPAAAAIDLPRLKRLVEDWPDGGWETDDVAASYRLALLRGVSTGHFVRRATGSNA
ncbi:MAG TPA: asparagine synthase-related protein [Rhizomicrobium sp.]